MPRSKTDICNRALARIAASRISEIDDATDPTAALCRDSLDAALDYAVAAVSPQCARALAPLARLEHEPIDGEMWRYRYALPKTPRCLRMLSLNGGNTHWEILGDTLASNADRANALYLFRPQNMDSLPEHLVAVVVLKLAHHLAYVKQMTASLQQTLLEELEAVVLPEAHTQERLQTGDNGQDTVNPKGTWYRG